MANTANIKAVITAEDRASGALKNFGSSVQHVGARIGSIMSRAAIAFGAATTAATVFSVKSAADFQQSRIAFETMLGSADAAKKMLREVSDFAARTPFELPEVVTGAKQLLAYNIEAEKILPTFKALGNIAAGVGKDKLPQLILAFGQVRAATRLTGMELRQFTEAGVPMLTTLAKQLGKTEAQIQDMVAAGEIKFKDVEKAIFGMSQEGGKFFNLMERQSKTFGGVMSNIRDQIGRVARSAVGISDEGDIREGSIFAMLSDVAQKTLVQLESAGPRIEKLLRDIVDAGRLLFGGDFQHGMFGNQFAEDSPVPQTILAVRSAIVSLATFIKDTAISTTNAFRKAWGHIGPSLLKLSETVNKDLAPTLKRLWKEVLEPMMPVIGVGLVAAIKVQIEYINLLVKGWSSAVNTLLDVDHFFRVTFPNSLKEGFNALQGIFQLQIDLLVRTKDKAIETWRNFVNFYDSETKRLIGVIMRLPNTIAYVLGYITGLQVKFITEDIPNFINAQIEWYGKLPGAISEILSRMWQTIVSWFTGTKEAAVSQSHQAVQGTVREFTSLPDRLFAIAQNLWNRVKSGFVNFHVELIRWAQSTANAIVDEFKKIPDRIKNAVVSGAKKPIEMNINVYKGLFDSFKKGFNIGNNAAGTDNWRGGPTWVGEKGPEIVNLPRGSQVIPNDKLGGGTNTYNINVNVGMYAGTEMEKRKMAESLMRAFKDVADSKNMAWGM